MLKLFFCLEGVDIVLLSLAFDLETNNNSEVHSGWVTLVQWVGGANPPWIEYTFFSDGLIEQGLYFSMDI